MTPREIALSICEPWFNGDPCDGCECHKVCTKLVERIETAIRAERVPETNFGNIPQPVVYISGYHKGRCIIEAVDPNVLLPVGMALYRSPLTSQESRQVEPVAWMICGGVYGNEIEDWEIEADQVRCDEINNECNGSNARIPLYPAPPKREPLTDEEIADLWGGQLFHITDLKVATDFVRDIERAHGIGGEE